MEFWDSRTILRDIECVKTRLNKNLEMRYVPKKQRTLLH